jgi:hypothetical protein
LLFTIGACLIDYVDQVSVQRNNNPVTKSFTRIIFFLSRPKYKKAIFRTITAVAILVVILGYVGGYIAYAYAQLQCGKQPIVAVTILGSERDYFRPVDSDYYSRAFGLNSRILTSVDYYCSEQDAILHDFRGKIGSLSDYESAKNLTGYTTNFSPDKIKFVAYAPSYMPSGFTLVRSTIQNLELGDEFTTFDQLFKDSNGTDFILISQALRGDVKSRISYCVEPGFKQCGVVGKDSNNNTVYSSQDPLTPLWTIYLKNSLITIFSHGATISDGDAISIFSSMQQIK